MKSASSYARLVDAWSSVIELQLGKTIVGGSYWYMFRWAEMQWV